MKAIKLIMFISISLINTTFETIKMDLNWLTNHFLDDINIKTLGRWTAERNHFSNYSNKQLKILSSLRGYHLDPHFKPHTRRHANITKDDIPENFDAREHWPLCSSIGKIRNQGLCGGCWAFAATDVMSDRLCIATEGMIEFSFSAEELISCCKICGDGCEGGFLFPPFEYWKYIGIPSGEDGHKEGCKPFTASNGFTPICQRLCQPGYSKVWKEDIRHGKAAYHVEPEVLQIQAEILLNGPVAAAIDVYQDFYAYKEGVYDHVTWEFVGHHAVKIIGWGIENGLPYWLSANSWGTGFGINGFAKILRGVNQCGIEYQVTACIPNNNE